MHNDSEGSSSIDAIHKCAMLSVLGDVLLRIPVSLCPTPALKRELAKSFLSPEGEVFGILFPTGHSAAEATLGSADDMLQEGVVEAGGDLVRILRCALDGLSAIMHVDSVYHQGTS